MSLAPASSSDQVLEAIQKVVDLLNSQASAGLSHSGVTKSVALTTSNTEIFHGLGRAPTIACPVFLAANAVVYSDTVHTDPRNYIWLKASAAVTATVLIA